MKKQYKKYKLPKKYRFAFPVLILFELIVLAVILTLAIIIIVRGDKLPILTGFLSFAVVLFFIVLITLIVMGGAKKRYVKKQYDDCDTAEIATTTNFQKNFHISVSKDPSTASYEIFGPDYYVNNINLASPYANVGLSENLRPDLSAGIICNNFLYYNPNTNSYHTIGSITKKTESTEVAKVVSPVCVATGDFPTTLVCSTVAQTDNSKIIANKPATVFITPKTKSKVRTNDNTQKLQRRFVQTSYKKNTSDDIKRSTASNPHSYKKNSIITPYQQQQYFSNQLGKKEFISKSDCSSNFVYTSSSSNNESSNDENYVCSSYNDYVSFSDSLKEQSKPKATTSAIPKIISPLGAVTQSTKSSIQITNRESKLQISSSSMDAQLHHFSHNFITRSAKIEAPVITNCTTIPEYTEVKRNPSRSYMRCTDRSNDITVQHVKNNITNSKGSNNINSEDEIAPKRMEVEIEMGIRIRTHEINEELKEDELSNENNYFDEYKNKESTEEIEPEQIKKNNEENEQYSQQAITKIEKSEVKICVSNDKEQNNSNHEKQNKIIFPVLNTDKYMIFASNNSYNIATINNNNDNDSMVSFNKSKIEPPVIAAQL